MPRGAAPAASLPAPPAPRACAHAKTTLRTVLANSVPPSAVLHEGTVREYDTPSNLLAQPGSGAARAEPLLLLLLSLSRCTTVQCLHSCPAAAAPPALQCLLPAHPALPSLLRRGARCTDEVVDQCPCACHLASPAAAFRGMVEETARHRAHGSSGNLQATQSAKAAAALAGGPAA